LKALEDDLQHAIRVLQDVIVPESENNQTLFTEKAGPDFVTRELIGMLTAVELNHQSSLPAEEVADVRAYWHLAAELEPAQLSRAQTAPQPALSIGRVIPQLLSAFGRALAKLRHACRDCPATRAPASEAGRVIHRSRVAPQFANASTRLISNDSFHARNEGE
jgi:hypothetical protein